MSVRQSLLALLDLQPMYGSQLRTEFESRTGATWPLNIGQVYTTLARLQRDGLVVVAGDDAAGHTTYAITDDGRAEVRQWFVTPVGREAPPRDELAIKLALAVSVPGVDVHAVVQTQRTATVQALQEYTRLKHRAGTAPTPTRASWPGCWCSTPSSSRPRRRCAGSTTARPGWLRASRAPQRHARPDPSPDPRRDRPDGGPPMSARPGAGRRHAASTATAPTAVHALRGISLQVARRRARRGHGPVRLRQVDPADLRRRPGPPHRPGEVSVEGTPLSTLRPAQASRRCAGARWATSSRTSTSSPA